ncbi:37 kDa salivary gland allergen Aed a 2-like [Anopheles ziemanni]|uniref:37 kDa salivary gland allergen Aed a 2-like n=1 Tax=Anopheles coustani TaxID=139045 RepID=UPI00265A6789|nr:37 kDa salivary gland allergen Aed a 2-like [Anopheles coustani]XP_058178921.1 37 kDa salivary gland allergen Aed a 2-like [Anopheles ziemanni]
MISKVVISFFAIIALVQLAEAAKTVAECEKQMPSSLKGRLCELRQYKIIDGQDMDKHMDCVMKTIGFVDKDGRGDYHKLIKPLNAIEKHKKHDFNLETCMGKTFRLPNAGSRANAFYKCMLQSDSAESFKKVFDLTELILAGKLSAGAQYDNKAANMMKKIDAKICK